MRRKEVWWVDFEPSLGGEIQKKRPAIIISNDASNKHLNRVQVVPVTSKTEKVYPGECHVHINRHQHKALASQIMTVSKQRLDGLMGVISDKDMAKVEQAVKIQLSLL